MRRDFTISERVAIAAALEEEMGERRGNPNLKKSNNLSISLPVDRLDKPGRTDTIVAKKAGLGSKNTYSSAQKVVTVGTPELVKAMDKKAISIKDAVFVLHGDPPEKVPFLTTKLNHVQVSQYQYVTTP